MTRCQTDNQVIRGKDLSIILSKVNGNYYYSCKTLGVLSERILSKDETEAKRLAIKSVLGLITKSSRHYQNRDVLIEYLK